MEPKIVKLDSIDAYNRLFGLETRHPLVSVVDLKKATRSVDRLVMEYGVYALFLKNGMHCAIKYGRRPYDYQEGSVVSFSPGQVIEVAMTTPEEVSPDVVGLLFHPDLLYGTPLGEKIASFGFFDYSQAESLHLSADEREQFLSLLGLIDRELDRPVDKHTAAVLSADIQVLLEHLHRFYDRQFITRHKVNSEVVGRFRRELVAYYADGMAASHGVPSVSYFADKVNLSAGYFGDLVRKETGTSPRDLISLHVISEAKRMLASSGSDVSEIAYGLGFEYPAHFSRMFKRVTGVSPSLYRASNSSPLN